MGRIGPGKPRRHLPTIQVNAITELLHKKARHHTAHYDTSQPTDRPVAIMRKGENKKDSLTLACVPNAWQAMRPRVEQMSPRQLCYLQSFRIIMRFFFILCYFLSLSFSSYLMCFCTATVKQISSVHLFHCALRCISLLLQSPRFWK